MIDIEFTLGDEIIICDPANLDVNLGPDYDWVTTIGLAAVPGLWKAEIEVNCDSGYVMRVSAHHEDQATPEFQESAGTVPIDTGMMYMGTYDGQPLDPRIGKALPAEHMVGWANGIICSTGWGDGFYTLYTSDLD